MERASPPGLGLLGKDSLRILVEPEGDSFPLMEIGTCEAEASEQWDYVLVAHHHTQGDPRQVRQQQFLEELTRKGFHIKPQTIQDQKRVFFGIRADSSIFDLYRTLLLEPEGPAPHAELAAPTPVPVTTRIRIVNFVVMKTKTSAGGEGRAGAPTGRRGQPPPALHSP
uniref:anoctamin-9-like n=1 Tax=Macaca mulatta TaxID=9544 RepID=UPI0010A29FB1|nr:anoctamin-9-like [Macaca mulatta]